MDISTDDLSWAAIETEQSAQAAIDAAADAPDGSFQRSQYLTVAAQKIRDTRTFRGAANMAALFADDGK